MALARALRRPCRNDARADACHPRCTCFAPRHIGDRDFDGLLAVNKAGDKFLDRRYNGCQLLRWVPPTRFPILGGYHFCMRPGHPLVTGAVTLNQLIEVRFALCDCLLMAIPSLHGDRLDVLRTLRAAYRCLDTRLAIALDERFEAFRAVG